jgi:hypothetical protein
MDHSSLDNLATTDFERLILRMYRKKIEKEIEAGVAIYVTNAFKNGHTALEISDFFNLPLEKVKIMIEENLKSELLKS